MKGNAAALKLFRDTWVGDPNEQLKHLKRHEEGASLAQERILDEVKRRQELVRRARRDSRITPGHSRQATNQNAPGLVLSHGSFVEQATRTVMPVPAPRRRLARSRRARWEAWASLCRGPGGSKACARAADPVRRSGAPSRSLAFAPAEHRREGGSFLLQCSLMIFSCTPMLYSGRRSFHGDHQQAITQTLPIGLDQN